MHHHLQMLVKAKSKSEAEREAEIYLEPYGNGLVWDCYSIGGRWSESNDIINATHPDFKKRIKEALNAKQNKIDEYKRFLEKKYDTFASILLNTTNHIDLEKKEPLKNEIQDFIQSIKNHKEPLASGYDGLMALRIAKNALESFKTGDVVNV